MVVNPAAGRGRTRKMLEKITRAASAAGVAVEVSPEPDAPARLAKEAAAAGRDLVACGGDGVVSELAAVAADTGCRLAIVPTGAGNDFARELGYDTKNPMSAFDVLTSGQDQVVDLGRVNGRWYTCVTASGFDAEANRWANTVQRLSGTALYVAAMMRTLAVYSPKPYRLTVDGESHELEAWLVAVGNGPAYAGGMHITPNASMRRRPARRDRHRSRSPSRRCSGRSRSVFKGTHVSHPEASTFRGEHIELASLDTSTPMDVYADGERVGPLPATMEAVPDALTVRVPS